MWQLPQMSPNEILIYLRKSRTDDPLLSVGEVLAKHEQMLNEWIERNFPGGGTVPEENRYREVVSGETIDSRPKVKELLHRIESPNIRAVLIVEPQRLSRGDMEDIGRLVKILRYSETIVITLQYSYDLRDERDRDMFERELKRGNEFLEYQKRIMNNGRLLSVKNGNFIGQSAPYGYRKIQVRDGKQKYFTLEPDPETAPVVKMIFELYRDGNGMTRIADQLDALGIAPPKGQKWSGHTILGALSNKHYIGKVIWNHRASKRKIENGVVIVSRPRAAEYLEYDGKHAPIIDLPLWEAVQAKRGMIPPNKKSKNFENPIAGLLFCENCGRAMRRSVYHDKDGNDKSAPRYVCPNQRDCGNASSSVSDVLEEVAKQLQKSIADFRIQLENGSTDTADLQKEMTARLEKRLHNLRELEIAQWDEKIKGGIPAHVFERLNQKVLADIKETEKALDQSRAKESEVSTLRENVAKFSAALEALRDTEAPAREKNGLLKSCIKRIDYSRKRINGGHKRSSDPDSPICMKYTLNI